MIRLVKHPEIKPDSAEGIKIFETFRTYGDYAMFWHQDGGRVVISMLDGDMVISGAPTDYTELASFIGAVSPKSVFSNSSVLSGLGIYENSLEVSVLSTSKTFASSEKSALLSSKDVYGILESAGFELPEYEFFATDYCLRLNKGRLNYFAVDSVAVAICIGRKNVLVNGLASLKSGNGSRSLCGLLSNVRPQKAFVCAKREVEGFYIKNGFEKIYNAGYWRK